MRKDILVFNICNFMGRHGGAVLGENVVQSILSDFSCKKNKGVEDFLKYNAVEFSKKHQSVTYLILDKAENHEKLLRFYTDYGFKSYDERKIKGDITLVQMLKIL